jgi:hypothetical protein
VAENKNIGYDFSRYLLPVIIIFQKYIFMLHYNKNIRNMALFLNSSTITPIKENLFTLLEQALLY